MIEIRPMTETEVRQLVAWAGDEGWNPGLNDADLFWRLDRNGFLAVCENREFVGGGAVIRHSEAFGFMGLFIVDKPYRGKGLGTQLWFARRDRLLAQLSPNGSIGLDGVDAMVPFYANGGFEIFTRHRRFLLAQPAATAKRSEMIVPLDTLPLAKVAEYDRQCFPAYREIYLGHWINQPNAVSLGYVEEGVLLGFGVARPCLVGYKIGPLFADSPDVADELLQAFQLQLSSQPLLLDAPDNNPDAVDLCLKYRMEEVFGCTRMYHGPPPEIASEKIFGITTMEVG
ncbi:GNAT family N-acetyltransferase [Bremerella cremea]|uniref:GNAT family N-acetyltransferase n=1 Tax=Bremerella cremea TaxID=1031537 RepID=A0A368KMM8_9BACT|nr:GNAT family N-acetyltransferase [Bremerella cremea]RCS43957.1 GNAT family N-acetyltransferase [Bremerella cremea]